MRYSMDRRQPGFADEGVWRGPMPWDDTNPYLMDETGWSIPEGEEFGNTSPRHAGEAYPVGFRRVDSGGEEEPSYVYVREPQNFEPVGDSPIRQRMESLQQGSVYDSRPYSAPREHQGSPLRKFFNRARQAMKGNPQQNMNMPLSGR